jgi:amino acid adenylation domain-containing protein
MPILRDLAAHVANVSPLTLPPIRAADRTQDLPLSWAQQRLWFLEQFDPAASLAYHIPVALRLRGVLDSKALHAALDRIVARHEILRTTFIKADEGKPIQVIGRADVGFSLIRHDLRNISALEQQPAVMRLVEEEAHRPFDLTVGPLIRGQLTQLAHDEHVLLITQHHIVSDAWSRGILINEAAALYAAFRQGRPDPLPPLPIQYADYAVWQRDWLQGETLQAQIEFWRNHLAGAPALLELPIDHPRLPVRRYTGANVSFVLPPELTTGLKALSRRHDTTPFMTLLAGLSILLSRLSGQNDVVIGTPVANRQRTEVEALIGFFVNTLALRIKLGEMSVAGLLREIKALTLDAFANQDVPFEQVVEAVQPVRSLSHSPLFQVLMSLDNTPVAGASALPGLQITTIPPPRTTTRFDLLMPMVDAGEVITGNLSYAIDLFERPTIERFLAQFQTLLRAMAADDSQSIGELPLLTGAERQQLLVEWNATETSFRSDQLIHQLFEAQAAAQPDATAVMLGASPNPSPQLTYGELNQRANQLAHYLVRLGVRPDDRVALCVERSLDMVVGLLGILKAGGAYVPLDPALPEERLAFMLEDCAPVALLTQSTVAERLPATSMLRVLILDDPSTQTLLAQQPADNLDPVSRHLTPSHLAYVIYTSGSTGTAKGVMIEHRSAVNFWQVLCRTTHSRCPPHARIGVNSAFSFDMSLKGLLQLLSGHCLIIIPEIVRADGERLLRFLEQHHVDAFECTPSQLDVLLAAGLLDSPSAPRSVLLGGEAIDGATWQRLSVASTHFYNMYGPTECTVDASITLINGSSGPPHIGRPIANTRIYLLDAHRQLVPIGVAGEIHIGGVQVARGYLNRPALTAERFLPDSFSGLPGARMYKSGDLGRYRPDGQIEFHGRNDFQVKLRGFRIELGEIEAQLRACRGVSEAVVIAREDSSRNKRLVAYLVPDEDAEPSIAALREQLVSTLPEYMVPAAYVQLPALPLTPNGKLDRQALPDPEGDTHLKRAYEAPVGEIEVTLAAIWQELLHIEQVGRHDHFFELGGHSLLAVEMITRMQKRGLRVDIRALFAAPTLLELADVTEKIKRITL